MPGRKVQGGQLLALGSEASLTAFPCRQELGSESAPIVHDVLYCNYFQLTYS